MLASQVLSATWWTSYPTLCRLHATDPEGFRRTIKSALRGTSLLVFPVALGCFLYPDIGIAFYDRRSFLPAEGNLRVLAIFVFLLYFTMPLGISIVAAGRQHAWTIVQSSCVLVSLVLDPLLVPWFQRHAGNGGIGVCVATVISEIFMVGAGLWLLPKGVLGKTLLRKLGSALLAGACMVLVALVLSNLNSFVRAPLAVLAYVAALWATRGIEPNQLLAMRGMLRRS